MQLINKITTKKYVALLDCIVTTDNPNLFTKDELIKLQECLNLNEDQLQLLIQSLLFIFKQSSKVILKLTDLYKDLVETLKFDADKANEFVLAWSVQTNKHFSDIENRWKLNNVCMELDVELNRNTTVPKVRMQLDVVNSTGNIDNIIMDLNEEEMVNLYSTLENVQTKLDKLQM